MKCPNCADTSLMMSDRQGVEIDYCPTCRGIWLDRGELDKLLDRAAATMAPGAHALASAHSTRQQPNFEDSDYRAGKGYQRSRHKSWLNEIFD